MFNQSQLIRSTQHDSDEREGNTAVFSANELPVLPGIKDAENSSLKLDISDISLQRLREISRPEIN